MSYKAGCRTKEVPLKRSFTVHEFKENAHKFEKRKIYKGICNMKFL